MIKLLKPDFRFEDDRGSLVQLVHNGYEQVNVLETKAGVLRGGHYHKKSLEAFYVISGSVELSVEKDGAVETQTYKRGDFFQIQPYVRHSMYFPADCVMVAMYDHCVEQMDGSKDIFVE